MNKVYVVAWEYNTGGGFDWYYSPETADRAFEEEKRTANELKEENWTAARFDFETEHDPSKDQDAITFEIDSQLCELFDKAEVKYKAN